MIRTIIFLLLIASLSLGISWLADVPSSVVIDWANYHIETSVLLLIAVIAILSLLFLVSYLIIFAIIRLPRVWLKSRLVKRQALGLQYLTETFVAISTQDIALAKKKLSVTQQYIPHQPLVLIFAAQLAKLEGNESQARLYLEKMLTTEGAEIIALRSLIEKARQNNDNATALNYAEKAISIKPQDNWTIITLAELYAKYGRIQDGMRLLDLSLRKKYITKEIYNREKASLLYENALLLVNQNRHDFAIAILQEALRKLPDFIEATTLLAELHIRNSEFKQAIKVIGEAWKILPQPDLTKLLLECLQKDKKVASYIKKIIQINPAHQESIILAGKLGVV